MREVAHICCDSLPIAECLDVDLPLCSAWKTPDVAVAGHEDVKPETAIDALNEPVGLYAARDGMCVC